MPPRARLAAPARLARIAGLTLGKLALARGRVDLLDFGERHDDVRRAQQVVHLLEGAPLGLVQEQPEEEGVGEAADGEDEVVLPA